MGQPAPSAPSDEISWRDPYTSFDDKVQGAHGGPPVVSHGFAVVIGDAFSHCRGGGRRPQTQGVGRLIPGHRPQIEPIGLGCQDGGRRFARQVLEDVRVGERLMWNPRRCSALISGSGG